MGRRKQPVQMPGDMGVKLLDAALDAKDIGEIAGGLNDTLRDAVDRGDVRDLAKRMRSTRKDIKVLLDNIAEIEKALRAAVAHPVNKGSA